MTIPPIIDKYEIRASLGNGSFGQVFRVFDHAMGAEKAIKILDVTDPAKFVESLQEAHILNGCRHKHIVTINEANVFPVGGAPRVILDLEYIPGGSLEGLLSRRFVTAKEAVTAIRGALHGLEHAHSQGFLHRDIKPGNILLDVAHAKLSDFGLATPSGSALVGSAQGYTTHLPPEYFTCCETNAQSDVFAAGVTLFRAVANIEDWRDVLSKVRNRHEKILRGTLVSTLGFPGYVPLAIKRIVLKACAADSARRFSTALELGQKLDGLRFNIDWARVASGRWEGVTNNDHYSIELNPAAPKVEFKKNGRRVNLKCRTFPLQRDAIAFVHGEIAQTTLF